ncbi:MAG: aspartate aminotransferase family protein [Chromatiales bacterium]|jgi:putrescine aminotransferase|nr:aspartate aminotransferase family protein [Chromatiales bacterium]
MLTPDEIERWQDLDRRHYLHPFTDHSELGARGTRLIERGDGVYIQEASGHRLLDAMSGLWCVNLGYGRQELIDAACHQLQQLPFYNSFFQCTHSPAIRLAEQLCAVAPPGFSRVFFTNSGSEANDTVIRMVRYYWALQGQPERQVIIARRNAYHGSTVGAASLCGMPWMHAQAGLPIPGIVHIEQPYAFGLAGNQDPAEFGRVVARQLDTAIRDLGPGRVAAFIAEPVQGAGGAIIPPDTYWPEIQRICDAHGILLVADEVITGFGRLGQWFGSQHYGIRPDLMPFAKGVTSGYQPLGGVLVGDRVADVLVAKGGEFFHGFTYSGHPVACAVASATLEVLQRERLIERAREQVIPAFAARWQALADHPNVGEARSVGLIGALELVRDRAGRQRFAKELKVGERCRDLCIEQGLVMRAVGDTMIVAPPLVITEPQLDELVEKARRAVDLTIRSLRA